MSRKVVVPRQLATVIGASAAVIVATLAIFYVIMQQTSRQTSAVATAMAEGLTRGYTLLETIDDTRSGVQRLLRMRDPDELEKAVAALEASRKQMDALFAQAGDGAAAIKAGMEAVKATEQKVIDGVLRGDLAGASELFLSTANPQYEKAQDEIRKYQQAAKAAGIAQLAALESGQRLATRWAIVFVGALLVCLAGYQWRLRARLVAALFDVARGLSDTSHQLADSSSQVASTSQSVSQGSTEQAASLEETSAALEEMSSMSRQSAQNAEHAKALAAEARTAAERGAGDMQLMGAAMDEIRAASTNIAKIIKTIDEIAFQTNILALNAAVEAARAGEAGMGFAVVADEVRNLAQRAAQAARDTAEKIEDSIAKSARGVELRDKVVGGLQNIVGKAREVDALVSEIVTASHQQRQGIEQVSGAVQQMESVTQSGAASAEESAAAAEELNGQAHTVKMLVTGLLDMVGAAETGAIGGDGGRTAGERRVEAGTPAAAGRSWGVFRRAA